MSERMGDLAITRHGDLAAKVIANEDIVNGGLVGRLHLARQEHLTLYHHHKK